MGGTCAKLQDEEETILNIFNQMLLNEIDVSIAYEEFLKCIKDNKIDYFLFPNFINSIIGYNNYQNLQNNFFENLRKDKNNIKKIGSLIIYLANGSSNNKINNLRKHFKLFYVTNDNLKVDENLKEYILDIIITNTYYCYETFCNKIGDENMKTLNQVWCEKRKEKLLFFIYQNYESVKYKYQRRASKEEAFDEDLPQITNETINIIVDEFIELTFMQLRGEFIRDWLYEDYMRESNRTC